MLYLLQVPVPHEPAFHLNLADYATLIAIVSALLVANRWYIKYLTKRAVEEEMEEEKKVLEAKIDGVRLNLQENGKLLEKVHDLEVSINNGLIDDVKELKAELAALRRDIKREGG